MMLFVLRVDTFNNEATLITDSENDEKLNKMTAPELLKIFMLMRKAVETEINYIEKAGHINLIEDKDV